MLWVLQGTAGADDEWILNGSCRSLGYMLMNTLPTFYCWIWEVSAWSLLEFKKRNQHAQCNMCWIHSMKIWCKVWLLPQTTPAMCWEVFMAFSSWAPLLSGILHGKYHANMEISFWNVGILRVTCNGRLQFFRVCLLAWKSPWIMASIRWMEIWQLAKIRLY